MILQVSQAERDLLLEILTTRLGEFAEQVHHARVSQFSDALKLRRQMLAELIERLESGVEAHA